MLLGRIKLNDSRVPLRAFQPKGVIDDSTSQTFARPINWATNVEMI